MHDAPQNHTSHFTFRLTASMSATTSDAMAPTLKHLVDDDKIQWVFVGGVKFRFSAMTTTLTSNQKKKKKKQKNFRQRWCWQNNDVLLTFIAICTQPSSAWRESVVDFDRSCAQLERRISTENHRPADSDSGRAESVCNGNRCRFDDEQAARRRRCRSARGRCASSARRGESARHAEKYRQESSWH
jgi:hypothetical protein